MSSRTAGGDGASAEPFPQPALVGVVAAMVAYLSVFYHVTDVVGGSGRLLLVVALTVAAATVLGRVVPLRVGLALGAGLLVVGGLVYVYSVPQGQRALFTADRIAQDTVSLLTGLSVLRLTEAGAWALSMVPVPTFLAWYLSVRDRYVAGAAVAGGTLGFFVLTGDAGVGTTLFGVVGLALAAALSTLDVAGGVRAHWETVAVALVAMVVLSATLSVVPGGAAQPLFSDRGDPTVEASLVGGGDSIEVVGSIRLSPEVRFTVESDREAYWRTGAYDRYTGDGWVSTGEASLYEGDVGGPPGDSDRVEQRVTAETDLGVLPAAWQPVSIEGDPAKNALVTDQGAFQPGSTVREGESYAVVSEVPNASDDELRAAGTDYPDDVEQRYTQLPESTPDRVGERTDEVTRDAENPYEAAVAVERHLESEKSYSLDVERPDGDVADGFLFEMEAGYCTYYATTMVVMLRTQGIPARMVTGYTPGEQTDDEWVVRGQNAHAWVEVYFPEHGWVAFDPTPSEPRDETREQRLQEARSAGEEGVDTEATVPDVEQESAPEPGETPTETPGNDTETNATEDGTPAEGGPDPVAGNGGDFGGQAPGDIDRSSPDPGDSGDPAAPQSPDDPGGSDGPPRELFGYGVLALLGAAVGAHRVGWTDRAYRGAWARAQFRRRDPDEDVFRAFDRLEYLLARRHRPRRPGETTRSYLRALERRGVDPRAVEVGALYERARYGGGVSREEADRAVSLVRRLAVESTPAVGRLFRR